MPEKKQRKTREKTPDDVYQDKSKMIGKLEPSNPFEHLPVKRKEHKKVKTTLTPLDKLRLYSHLEDSEEFSKEQLADLLGYKHPKHMVKSIANFKSKLQINNYEDLNRIRNRELTKYALLEELNDEQLTKTLEQDIFNLKEYSTLIKLALDIMKQRAQITGLNTKNINIRTNQPPSLVNINTHGLTNENKLVEKNIVRIPTPEESLENVEIIIPEIEDE